MSLVTAFTLPDGALIVTDGRVTHPLNRSLPSEDNIDKLHRVDDKIYIAPLGVTQITDLAINNIKSRYYHNKQYDLKGLIDILSEELHTSMITFEKLLEPNLDRTASWMIGALMVGGIIKNTPFICEIKHSYTQKESLRYTTRPWQGFPIGGSQNPIHIYIFKMAMEGISKTKWEENVGPINNRIISLIKSVVVGIQIATPDDDIGGTIRFVVIRKNFDVYKDIWNQQLNEYWQN